MEIACIVEGDGEDEALPVLVRRLVTEVDPTLYVRVSLPVSWSRGRLVKQQLLASAVSLAAQRATASSAILIVLDADDDCPKDLGADMLAWAQSAWSDVPIGVVIANREYEAWFLAAAESLRGHRGLRDDLTAPVDCDSIRDAKGWLKARAAGRERYDPIDHQASFSAQVDLEMARQNSRSFRNWTKRSAGSLRRCKQPRPDQPACTLDGAVSCRLQQWARTPLTAGRRQTPGA